MTKIIDHLEAPSRSIRDQLVKLALKGGFYGWMPDSKTDPEDKFHYSWPRCQHRQIDNIVNRVSWAVISRPTPGRPALFVRNPWK